MLPEIDLHEHGLSAEEARNAMFTVGKNNGELLYTNRANGSGLVKQMPCPSLNSGQSAIITPESGKKITVKTV